MASLCCVRSYSAASPGTLVSPIPRSRHYPGARDCLPLLVFPPHSLLQHVFLRCQRSRREPTVHCHHLPGNVVEICAGKEHKRRRDCLRLGALSLTGGRPRPGAGLHAVALSRAEALSSGECNHGLEYANDLPTDLLSVVLLEPLLPVQDQGILLARFPSRARRPAFSIERQSVIKLPLRARRSDHRRCERDPGP